MFITTEKSDMEQKQLDPRPRDRWELHFPAATGNARLPLVALGPESSGSGSTLALARIHANPPGLAGAPAGAVKHIEAINVKRPALALDHIHAGALALPVRPPLRQSYRG
ncbi:hypothetical protein NDU88_003911 [Pleurodeles waltl]|uniref:Uncharacterized protein n=1 Tax=Pleurodeles waltl TaxID=8319 RepID=A0AAV7SH98_PLEWA|nr:hypothetical protein NDU88_003911 [Pleurodeles waltl]